MLNSDIIIADISNLIAKKNEKCIIGNGILSSMKIAFNEEKLAENKSSIAQILQEIGLDQYPLTNLANLTTLKNGETWNKLETLKDFQALEFLLACSSACGFIKNDTKTISKNIENLGGNSLFITLTVRKIMNNDEKWLEIMKQRILQNMHFLTNPATILEYSSKNKILSK